MHFLIFQHANAAMGEASQGPSLVHPGACGVQTLRPSKREGRDRQSPGFLTLATTKPI